MGGSAGGKSGRGLHEVGAGGLGQLAGPDLLVVGEIGVLEDDLDDRPSSMSHVDHGRDIGLDIAVATGLQRADLEHHVELGRAIGEGALCLEHLCLGLMIPMGKADGGADGDVRPVQQPVGTGNVRRTHAHRRHVVFGSQPAPLLDERIVELGAQQ